MRKITTLLITAIVLMMNGCSGGGGSSTDTTVSTNEKDTTVEEVATVTVTKPSEKSFAYETQRDVAVTAAVTADDSQSQKQILIYEEKITETTPVGDLERVNGLLVEGIVKRDGTFTAELTLGHHITSLWVVIPAIAYQNEHQIINDHVVLTLGKGE